MILRDWTELTGQYLKAIWDVVNFEEAEKRLQAAQ
jgi:superoxide dismutase